MSNQVHLRWQETTRFIDQISTVGANVQKLCSDFMDDILPPITEINDKCSFSKFSVESEEDLNLNENSDQGEDTIEFSFCEEVDESSSALVQVGIVNFMSFNQMLFGAYICP